MGAELPGLQEVAVEEGPLHCPGVVAAEEDPLHCLGVAAVAAGRLPPQEEGEEGEERLLLHPRRVAVAVAAGRRLLRQQARA